MSASNKKKLRKELNEAKMTERQRQEQAETKKIKRLTFAFVAVLIVIVGIFVVGRAVDHVTRYGVFEKNTIAATIGEHKLNSVTMNYFFRDAIDSRYNTYYQYLGDSASSYLGFDVTKPLNEQDYDAETGSTWGDYFFDEALENARSAYTMYDVAQADSSFALSDDAKSSISSAMLNLQLYASIYGYSSVDGYLRELYGNGSDAKSYEEYLTIRSIASEYYNYHYDSLVYDDAAIREYDTAHPGEYDSYSYHSYTISSDKFLGIDLTAEPEVTETAEPEVTETAEPEVTEAEATEPEVTEAEATEPEATVTYTDEEKQAARDAAKAAAESLKSATTVEELDAAIAALIINKDTTAASSGSTDIAYSNLSATFKDWLVSADRQAGDVEMFENKSSSTDADGNTVETVTGYTVVMFDGRNTNETKMADIRQVLIAYEGGTTDDNGTTTYSDEEKAAARTKAEELLQAWKDGGATLDAFITLVNDNDSNATDGGLVENINKQSSYDYKTWAMDESRQVGDTTIIDSTSGCYIVYYVGDSSLNYRDYMISEARRTEEMTAWQESIIEAVTPVKGNTSKVRTWMVYMPASN